jgi:hypothetical protein
MLVDAKASNKLYKTVIEIKEVHCDPTWNNVLEWLDSVIDSFQKSNIKKDKVVEEVKIDLNEIYMDSLMQRARGLLVKDKFDELTHDDITNIRKIKEWNQVTNRYYHINDKKVFFRIPT